MNCSELRDYYELYALGVSEDPERAEIRDHLQRGCEVCGAGMRGARELTALLGASSPAAAPSRQLRGRILAAAGGQSHGFGWTALLAGTTALSVAAAVYFGGREADFSRQTLKLTEEARAQNIELTHLNEAFAILNGADTTVISFGEKKPTPKGKVFVNPKMGVLLLASSLPPAPAGKAYELWLIPKSKTAKPVPAGIFQAEADGTAMHMARGPVEMNSTAAVAVTMEIDRGVDQPTSAPMIVAPLAPAVQ